MVLLITFLIFIVIAIGVFAFGASFDERNSQSRLLRDRLSSVDAASTRNDSEELALLRDELLSEIPALNRILSRSHSVPRLRRFLSQADVRLKAGKFLLICVATTFLGGWITFLISNSLLFSMLGTFFGLMIPISYISVLRSRRFHKFEQEFPEAIEFLARAVRAGHAFSTALEMIACELGEPVAGEFRKLYEEQKFGLPIRDALLNLVDRMPIVDVKFFVTAVMLQRETGGNLAEILDKLSYVNRERFKILRQVRTFTAQGRLTLGILMCLPVGLLFMLFFMNREFITPLFHDSIGHAMIFTAVTLQIVGFFIIRKIINIEV